MEVRFLDLSYVNGPYYEEFSHRFKEMYFDSRFIKSVECAQFEEEFAKYCGALGCVGVANGTDAIEIAIKALNLPKGSQIILPANTFKATAEAVLNMGFKAAIVDCDENYNISPQAILSAITPQTSAIIVVHLYGRVCDMNVIMKIAQDYGLLVIEDCSQAHGARIKIQNEVRSVGSIGDVGTFSFYPSKNLGAIGDGGAIISNTRSLLDRARNIANHSLLECKPSFVGRNSRLDSIQAMFLSLKLRDLDTHNAYRAEIAAVYHEVLSKCEGVVCPEPSSPDACVWHNYVIRLIGGLAGCREMLQKFLEIKGVQTHIHYPLALNKIPELKSHIHMLIHPLPNASNWDRDILSLPMGAHVTKEQAEYVANCIIDFSARH